MHRLIEQIAGSADESRYAVDGGWWRRTVFNVSGGGSRGDRGNPLAGLQQDAEKGILPRLLKNAADGRFSATC